jgi:hypothetical protein
VSCEEEEKGVARAERRWGSGGGSRGRVVVLWEGEAFGGANKRMGSAAAWAALWARRDSAVRELVRETLRLVGADREERRVGMVGGKSMVSWEPEEVMESDILRCRIVGGSKWPGILDPAEWERGAEWREAVFLDRRLLVDLKDGACADFIDDRRSGITMTGILPSARIFLRDFVLDVVLAVALDWTLTCFI